jgi:NAD(P)-dependent dehydrogenase (short-subunit alcohol dehydrogenase family)
MTRVDGQVAVVTGAGSGIGRALALALADRGCRLVLADVAPAGLAEVDAACAVRGADVLTAVVDVADAEAVEDLARRAVERFGGVQLVFNNAGVALSADATDQSLADIRRVLDVNLWGVIHGCQTFLPRLLEAGEGHLVNVSSLFGLLAAPGQSAYNASKFGVRGYSEALAVELAVARSPVRVSTVHPGGVATNIARHAVVGSRGDAEQLRATFDAMARTSPDEAARVIIRGVERNRRRILVGADAKVLHLLVSLAGARYIGLIARYAERSAPAATASLRMKEGAGASSGLGVSRPARRLARRRR